MRLFRWLIILAVLIGALWCAYWYAATFAIKTVTDRMIERGRLAHSGLAISGFPTRFHMEFQQLKVVQPNRSMSVQFAQPLLVTASAFTPWSVDFSGQGDVTASYPQGGHVGISSDDFSGHIDANFSGGLDAFKGVVNALEVVLPGQAENVKIKTLSVVAAPELDRQQDLSFQALDVALPATMETPFGRQIQSISMLGVATPAIPMERRINEVTVRKWQTAGGNINIKVAEIRFPNVSAGFEGTVSLDDALQPAISGDFVVENDQVLVQTLVQQGMIPAGVAFIAGGVLASSRQNLSTGATQARIPLVVSNGLVTVNGLPVPVSLPQLDW